MQLDESSSVSNLENSCKHFPFNPNKKFGSRVENSCIFTVHSAKSWIFQSDPMYVHMYVHMNLYIHMYVVTQNTSVGFLFEANK